MKTTISRRGNQVGLKSIIDILKELAPVAETKRLLVSLQSPATDVLVGITDYQEIFAALILLALGWSSIRVISNGLMWI